MTVDTRSWFCVRSQPKREHIAAAHLRTLDGVEVFNPRLRVKKSTRRGVVTFVEPLFPNYLFAKFNPYLALDKVKYSPSVNTIVHFGSKLPTVPDEVIDELRADFAEDNLKEIEHHVKPGDQVIIGEGPFYGMRATVLRVMSPYQRVEVLMEMLGRTAPVMVDPRQLLIQPPS